MQDIRTAETTRSIATEIQSGIHATYLPNMLARRWVGSRRPIVVVVGLISWDALLALAMWQAAFVLQAVLGKVHSRRSRSSVSCPTSLLG